MRKTLFISIIAVLILLMASCSMYKKVSNGMNVYVTNKGLVAEGTEQAYRRELSMRHAMRTANMEMLKYINSALAALDNECGLSSGTHKEQKLMKSNMVGTKFFKSQDGLIGTVYQIEVEWKNLQQWADAYYDGLSDDDTMRTLKKSQFKKKIMKYFRSL